ncbi:MAG: hypothetical protein PHG05_03280 [Candidatus Nanoarchaeia archaeon]|nr:hypothetical protein [Candidatus Nanoarchaeia archaeon]
MKKTRKNSSKTKSHHNKKLYTILLVSTILVVFAGASIIIGTSLKSSNETLAGYAAKVVCTDSDSDLGGSSIYVNGTVTIGQTSASDECDAEKTKVKEFYCKKNKGVYKLFECPGGCEDGACIRRCSDTDMNQNFPTGEDPFTVGTVTFQNQEKTDECVPGKSNVLNEWYCDPQTDTSKQRPIKCANGCSDGACIRSCSDTDATEQNPDGRNIYVKGNMSYKKNVYFDYCHNKKQDTLYEWSCNLVSDKYKKEPVTCPLKCVDGACKQPKEVECSNQIKNSRLTIEYDVKADLSDSCSGCVGLSSVKTVYIHSNIEDSLVVNPIFLDGDNSDKGDKKTNKIWVSDVNPSTSALESSKLFVYYWANNKVQYAGFITSPERNRFAQIIPNDGVNAELFLWENLGRKVKDNLRIDLEIYQKNNPSEKELMQLSWARKKGITSLGASGSNAEATELIWEGLQFGTRIDNITTLNGVTIESPAYNGKYDKEVFWIPLCSPSVSTTINNTGSCEETDNGKNVNLKGNLTYKGNEYIDVCGKDYAISIPRTGKLKITYLGSSAELVSGFFMDADPEPVEIFPENKKIAQNTIWETVYHQGDKLNFFIRVYGNKWGIGIYDHYAEGQLDPYTNKSYGIVTQLSDTKWRIGFEDLPGEYIRNNKKQYSDWDYNDEVVEIEIVAPDGGWIDENPEACTGTKTDTSVLEYYCENITKKCEFIECPLGCEDGACKQPETPVCIDSDGKKNFDTIGTCKDSTGTYNDGCSTNYIQKDYYCENNLCSIATKSCPAGSVCKNGKCGYTNTNCDATAYTYKVGDSYYIGLDIAGSCNEDITVGYAECKCPNYVVDTLGGTQYNGYCTQDAAISGQEHLGCHLCVSKAMTFKAGDYSARKAFDFASCGTSQIDLLERISTIGLKFIYLPAAQKYVTLACAGSQEPSC